MNQNPSGNFLDPKTLTAILFLGLAWVGWQAYMQKKYPDHFSRSAEPKVEASQTEAPTETAPIGTNSSDTPSGVAQKNDEVADVVAVSEKVFTYFDENMSFELSSKGMGLKQVVLNKYTDRNGEKYTVRKVGQVLPLETNVIGSMQKLDFAVEQVGTNRFVGVAQYDNLQITKVIEVQSEQYVFNTEISVTGESDRFLGLQTTIVEDIKNFEQSILMPTFERQEFFAVDDGSSERVLLTKDEKVKQSFTQVSVASLGTQYFSQSLVDNSTIIPEFRVETSETIAIGTLLYNSIDKKSQFKISYQAFVGPKYLEILENIDSQLAGLIDFGIFSWLAKPMLQLMKWFHTMAGNWGIAIILLTLLVRVVVLPFTIMSYKSLNKMKIIQPQIKTLKEKYKDDTQKLNQEMMLLMKTHQVNPLGGCLPMLLQFPVFIALYQVLGQSIELYQAPFYFWIEDLSLKDPYYVLPVLMAITMFVQQKITPTTMDPAQAKVMLFLPLVFALFMVTLPSGLTLYIFVSALFAIIQQLFFMRDTTNQAVTTA
jgi:YidC/Oxa1 family membrane protein insertase